MPKIMVQQTAFNRGELDPALYGRSDWQQYFSGAKRLENMVCRPQGGAVKRAGTEYIETALRQDGPSRLIRFQYNVEQSYLLEFGGRGVVGGDEVDVFRVFKNGGLVLRDDGTPAVFPSHYSADEIMRVRVCQTEDKMFFTHPNHPPRTLTRYDHDDWRWEDLVFGSSLASPTLSLAADGRNKMSYVVTAITAGGEESLPSNMKSASTAPENPTIITLPKSVETMNYEELLGYLQTYGLPIKFDTRWMNFYDIINFLSTLGYSGEIYTDKVDTKWRGYNPRGGTPELWASNGTTELELIIVLNTGFRNTIVADMRNQLTDFVGAHNAANTVTGINILKWTTVDGAARYRVYRAAKQPNGSTKFWGIIETEQTTHTDQSGPYITPVISPPQAYDGQDKISPFDGPGNYPGVCAFYQQRLILGRTNNKPNTLWGSAVGAYKNFYRSETSDTAAWEFTLQADEVNEAYWIMALDDLLIGTGGGEFRMSGGSYIVTATNVNVNRQSNYGCAATLPVVIGRAILAVGRNGQTLRAFQYSYDAGAYSAKNVSHYAGHLFLRRKIDSLAFQSDPDNLLWAVMSDGSLLSCTYMNEEEVLGWSRHSTDGRFEAIASMKSEDAADEIWFVVAREIGGVTRRYIERMKTIQDSGDDIADAWYADSALTRDGMPAREFAGLDHLEGKKVVCLGDGNVFDGLTVTNGKITLDTPVSRAVVGLPYAGTVETMELEPLGGGSLAERIKRPVVASVLFYHSRECRYGYAHKPSTMKFRVENQGEAIAPRTIRKTVTIPAPKEGDAGGLWLSSPSPVPFGILSVAVEVSVGDMSPNPGRTA